MKGYEFILMGFNLDSPKYNMHVFGTLTMASL